MSAVIVCTKITNVTTNGIYSLCSILLCVAVSNVPLLLIEYLNLAINSLIRLVADTRIEYREYRLSVWCIFRFYSQTFPRCFRYTYRNRNENSMEQPTFRKLFIDCFLCIQLWLFVVSIFHLYSSR